MKPMKIDRREPVNIYRKRWKNEPGKHVRPATVIKYISLTIAGVLLFRAGQAQARIERGYEAVGGEVFALFLPLFYYLISRTVRDIIEVIRTANRRRNT